MTNYKKILEKLLDSGQKGGKYKQGTRMGNSKIKKKRIRTFILGAKNLSFI